jgi:HK97 family phage prohead protease
VDLGFIEQIKAGAFARALREKQDVRALVDHDSKLILGRTTAGTLQLKEDAVGLAYTVQLPDTQAGRDIWTSVKRGDVSQSSFAFIAKVDQWDYSGDKVKRTILDVDLYDVSPVTYPAYEQTAVSARSRNKAQAMADAVMWNKRMCERVRNVWK